MNRLDAILEECLRRMSAEGYSVEQCLEQFTQHRDELRPLLVAAKRLEATRSVKPSASYKSTTKAMIMARAEAHRLKAGRALHPAWRISAAVIAAVVVLLVSTTAFAQGALPGQALYEWKLASEQVWRRVSADRVGVDLALADRRATELTIVVSNPRGEGRARQEYHEVLKLLEAEMDASNGPKIDKALLAHQKKLSEAGIRDKKLDELVRGKGPKNK